MTRSDEPATDGGGSRPTTREEWRQRLPHLWKLFGAYYHQDAEGSGALEYFVDHSWDYDCAATVAELAELRRLCPEPRDLEAAVMELGAERAPSRAKQFPKWLDAIDRDLRRFMAARGYALDAHLHHTDDDETEPVDEPVGWPPAVLAWAPGPVTLEPVAASSYETDEDARRFAQRVIDDYATEIIAWVEDAPAGSLRGFEVRDVGEVTGRSLSRADLGDSGPRPVAGVRVVLKARPEARGGWYILNTYPVP